MATNANPFVVNIVDLQNIALSITGASTGSAIAQLQADVGNLQEMVDYETKTILVDTISEFTPGHGINVVSNLTTTTTSTTSSTATTTTQGTLGFGYTSGSLTNTVNGSLPTTFASSLIISGTTITIILSSTYSATYFPNYIGSLLWYNGSSYMSFPIPNGNYSGNYPYVNFNGSQIIISNLTNSTLPLITPDSSGYSLWLNMTIFN